MTTVVVLDYGSGNIHSVTSALTSVGARVHLTHDAAEAMRADGLVVPGVGAFGACMAQLRAINGEEILARRVSSGMPVLGICVGHQILFSAGLEHGVNCPGVGILPGVIEPIPARRVPHMGWNQVIPDPQSHYLPSAQWFYFVHSYAALHAPDDAVVSWVDHDGARFVAAVEAGPVLSTQFHPEKSGVAGLALLRRWVERVEVSCR